VLPYPVGLSLKKLIHKRCTPHCQGLTNGHPVPIHVSIQKIPAAHTHVFNLQTDAMLYIFEHLS
jgi:hypothetical protein